VRRRREFVDAALRVLEAQGPDLLMDAVAAEAGVTKPVLYRYFHDKAALVDALAERGSEILLDRLLPAIRAGVPALTRVRDAVGAYFAVIDEHPNLYWLLARQSKADAGGEQDSMARNREFIATTLTAVIGDYMRVYGLDSGGAESLLGQGDMLFRGAGTSKLQRIQGAFVTEEEIARITGHWAKQGEPEFEQELLEVHEERGVEAEGDFDPDSDDLLDDAIRVVVETETASVSMIQRRLRVGYTRAGRLIDMLERRGVISGYEGSKPRQVLVTQADLSRLVGGAGGVEPAVEHEPSGSVSD